MATTTYPGWKGFERTPAGRLLSQVVDITGAMGIAYERSVGFKKDFHVHDRDMLVCPRGASMMRIRTRAKGSAEKAFVIDADEVLFVPKTCDHDDESISAVYDTFALYPSDALLAESAKCAGIARRAARPLLAAPFLIRRSRGFTETLERYFIERVLAQRSGETPDTPREFANPRRLGIAQSRRSKRVAFLEAELVTEALRRAARPAGKRGEIVSLADDDVPFARALRFVDANLFEPIDIRSLAKRSGASVSTLLRAFQREVGLTPYAYVKACRLDVAKRLLRRGGVLVKEVALLVGYEELPAFSKAFKRRFGSPPSEHLPRLPTRRSRNTFAT